MAKKKSTKEVVTPIENLKEKVEELKDMEVPEHLEDLKEATIEFSEDLIDSEPDEIPVDRGGNPLEKEEEAPKYRWFRGKKYPIK